jgi:hypothetical protein
MLTQAAGRLFGATYDPPENVWLAVKFSPSVAGQAAGREFLKRTHLRQLGTSETRRWWMSMWRRGAADFPSK